MGTNLDRVIFLSKRWKKNRISYTVTERRLVDSRYYIGKGTY